MDAGTDVTNLNSAVAAIAVDIGTNETNLSTLELNVDSAEAAVLELAPDVDVFITNNSGDITWSNDGNNDLDGTNGTPDSTQCVDAGQTVQFYLSMTSTYNSNSPPGEVLDVQLLASNSLVTD